MTAARGKAAAVRWALVAGCAALGLWAPVQAAPAAPRYRLIGLAPLSDGRLVLVDNSLGLFVVDPRARTMRNLGINFGLSAPSDVTTHRPAGGDQVFVSVRLRSGTEQGIVHGRLQRFAVDGKLTGEWLAGPALALSGIAITADGRSAYLTGGQSTEVFRLDLSRARSTPNLVTVLPRAEKLGALVLDSKRRRLFVADPLLGTVNAVPLDRSRPGVFVDGFDEPTALALDSTGDRLFVIDAGENRIFAVELTAEKPKPRVFAVVKGLEDPHSLAVGADGSVWVTSYRNPTLYRLSATGSLVESFQPKLLDGAGRP